MYAKPEPTQVDKTQEKKRERPQKRAYPSAQFVKLSSKYVKQVWQWRNQDDIRKNMHNTAPIEWNTHLKWFEDLQASQKRDKEKAQEFFVFLQNERPIGVLNFKPCPIQESNSKTHEPIRAALEWGCYIGEQDAWPGSGLLLEVAALDYASTQAKVAQLYAEVLDFNQSVLKMHKLFGYKTLEDDSQRPQVKRFVYDTDEWRTNRTAILARLPKQIAKASELIRFA
uniref:UDP-4-amino-4, 6-dideoxy-N-acetyl-beta-L-altrosamine N-acetyltransferase n=1 Tax=Ningiella ruwaisensis TaxID=2364274 RepID=UPI0010A09F1B|nr:UDP-4-amino-4,6-dideoxy-N-acetyl-beta-L-altrosamine N-acetyltransferase [Ningiella ruwaisensis]